MEDIKFVKNPTSSYQIGRQADPYLQDYFSVKRADKSQKIISSATEQMDKNTNDLLDKIKKRVRQMEIREKNNQAKVSFCLYSTLTFQMFPPIIKYTKIDLFKRLLEFIRNDYIHYHHYYSSINMQKLIGLQKS